MVTSKTRTRAQQQKPLTLAQQVALLKAAAALSRTKGGWHPHPDAICNDLAIPPLAATIFGIIRWRLAAEKAPPSISEEKLAVMFGVSTRTVRRMLWMLEEAGYLIRYRRRRQQQTPSGKRRNVFGRRVFTPVRYGVRLPKDRSRLDWATARLRADGR